MTQTERARICLREKTFTPVLLTLAASTRFIVGHTGSCACSHGGVTIVTGRALTRSMTIQNWKGFSPARDPGLSWQDQRVLASGRRDGSDPG